MNRAFFFCALALVPSLCFAQVSLSLKLTKGKTYYHTTTAVSEMHQEIGEGIDIVTTISGKNSYQVTDQKDSVYHIKANYDQMGMKMKAGPQEIEFNSDAGKTDLMSQIMSSFINKPFGMDMTIHGNVIAVAGIDSMVSDMTRNIPGLSEEQKKGIEKQMASAFGGESFKSSFNMLTAIYPRSGTARKDEKWTSTITMISTMQLNILMSYELTGEGADYYTIHGEGTMATPANTEYTSSNGLDLKYDITGKMTSDITLDKATGWIRTAKMIQKGEGTLHIKASAMMPEGGEIPVSFTNTTEVKGGSL